MAELKPIATLEFTDLDTGEDAVAILRSRKGMVAITISLRRSGEAALFLTPDDAERFLNAFQKAVSEAKRESNTEQSN